MYVMSESSLPLLGSLRLRSFPGVARRVLGRLFGRKGPDPALVSRAASAIREYARDHAALFERAERLHAKADRLEREGIPSESAANRAERARREVEIGLLALRASFAASAGGREGERAFDHEVERMYSRLGISGQ
jgi:ferric-dicitrate binding protein FerR (iron transport regulator)